MPQISALSSAILALQMTGIDFEPWHYRYVGVEAARIIAAGGLCLEEFLHFYSEKYI